MNGRNIAIVVLVIIVLVLVGLVSLAYTNPSLTKSTTSIKQVQSAVVKGNFFVRPQSYQDYQISIPEGASNIVVSGQYSGTILSQQMQVYVMNATDFQEYWQNQASENNTSPQMNCIGACFEITGLMAPETYLVSGTSIFVYMTIENTGTYEATPEPSVAQGNAISISGFDALTLNPGQSETFGVTATALAVASSTKDTVTFVVENTAGQITDSRTLTFTVLPLNEYPYYSGVGPGYFGSLQNVNLASGNQNYYLVFYNPDKQSQNVSSDISVSYQIAS